MAFTIRRTATLGIAATTLLAGAACSRVPSPLTPGFRGSIGTPSRGVLSDAVALPTTGPGYRFIKTNSKLWGTRELVSSLTYAAKRVHDQRPGAVLHIGDLSARHGGKIPNHRSHRSGRDADLIFYTTDLGGASMPSPGWTNFGSDGIGLAHRSVHGNIYVRLDLERNWLLVKALMEAPHAAVMWLFVSRPIEALLTEYAIARGEDPVLVWHAENVMLQPRNALPHDDHFHIRIMCPPGSASQGCEEGGPHWPWLPADPVLAWPKSDAKIAEYLDVASMDPLDPPSL